MTEPDPNHAETWTVTVPDRVWTSLPNGTEVHQNSGMAQVVTRRANGRVHFPGLTRNTAWLMREARA